LGSRNMKMGDQMDQGTSERYKRSCAKGGGQFLLILFCDSALLPSLSDKEKDEAELVIRI